MRESRTISRAGARTRSGTRYFLDSGITPRLARRIRADFADDPEHVMELLESVESSNQGRERVVAAVVLGSHGDVQVLQQLIDLSRLDWRDVLIAGDVGNKDWPSVLNDQLGPPD
jgi:hypothetical protein